MEPIPRAVDVTRPAGRASGLARMEARRLGHQYLGPEHLLVGLLAQGDNLAARVLVANGLDLATVRAGIDRLIAQGVLPGPQPSDGELLASLGVDLEAVHSRLQASFGEHVYWDTAQRIRHRAAQPVPHTPHIRTDPTPLVCAGAPWASPPTRRSPATRTLAPSTCSLASCGKPRSPSALTCRPSRCASASCSACLTTAPTRSSCWSRAKASRWAGCKPPSSSAAPRVRVPLGRRGALHVQGPARAHPAGTRPATRWRPPWRRAPGRCQAGARRRSRTAPCCAGGDR